MKRTRLCLECDGGCTCKRPRLAGRHIRKVHDCEGAGWRPARIARAQLCHSAVWLRCVRLPGRHACEGRVRMHTTIGEARLRSGGWCGSAESRARGCSQLLHRMCAVSKHTPRACAPGAQVADQNKFVAALGCWCAMRRRCGEHGRASTCEFWRRLLIGDHPCRGDATAPRGLGRRSHITSLQL